MTAVPVALQAVGQGETVDLDNEDLGLVLAELLQGTPGDPSSPLLDERSSDASPSPDSASPGAIGAAAAGRMKRVGMSRLVAPTWTSSISALEKHKSLAVAPIGGAARW